MYSGYVDSSYYAPSLTPRLSLANETQERKGSRQRTWERGYSPPYYPPAAYYSQPFYLFSSVVAEGSAANSSLDPSVSSESQFPASSVSLSVAGGTSVTASLTQPLVSDKLMWSPSAMPTAAMKAENPTPG